MLKKYKTKELLSFAKFKSTDANKIHVQIKGIKLKGL